MSMKYRQQIARIEFDAQDKIFVGQLAGIKDIVVFHGSTVQELETAFHEAVDDYIEISEREGLPIQKPFSGTLSLRIEPDIHAAVATAADMRGISINQYISDVLAAESRL